MTDGILIRPVQTGDLPRLERLFPQGGADKHARRLLRQQNGTAVYLIAFLEEMPVGHVLLKWDGAQDEAVVSHRTVPCPDLEDLFVREGFRQRGIGTGLLRYAEQMAQRRGFPYIGLAVGLKNASARRLYERLGYRHAGIEPYTIRGIDFDEQGQMHTREETCVYLIKRI
ncbi:GNAT family N-acetyltransferase [Anaerolinea thermophila]|uniref:GNAT family N-acetyltransferase n=2 Tax=Anaerolinea TaxID=233189 RepID=UPI0026EF08B9|nr:GNAT family N-acetyltransferase [Anaerolinea thermophila]